MVELRVSQHSIHPNVNHLFGFRVGSTAVTQMKKSGTCHYKDLYVELFKRVTNGRMLHVDETKASIRGKEAYVWVFANLEEVAYVYRASRGANFVREALSEFRGVLISEFYAGYEGVILPATTMPHSLN